MMTSAVSGGKYEGCRSLAIISVSAGAAAAAPSCAASSTTGGVRRTQTDTYRPTPISHIFLEHAPSLKVAFPSPGFALLFGYSTT